jgi:hypothetical protein
MLPWDAAVSLVAAGLDRGDVAILAGVPRRALKPFPTLDAVLRACAGVARTDPAAANATLNAYLAGRHLEGGLVLEGLEWLTALPQGLRVVGFLQVMDTPLASLPKGLVVDGYCTLWETQVRSLPEGLQVGQGLLLFGETIQTLPEGLRVGGELDLKGCGAWDGRIPPDAEVGGKIRSNCHSKDLTLKQWRAKFPDGVGWRDGAKIPAVTPEGWA